MKYLKTLIAPVVAAFLAAGMANAAFYEWSKVAATNATADPTINWSEGMSPSSVNDSARALMARAAEYRDDISGVLATGGSATVYTVATNQVLPSTPTTGQLLAITPHATNGASPTLTADGGTAFPIEKSVGVPVAAATLIVGSPYTLKFTGTAWALRNFYGAPFEVPVGGLVPFTGSTSPNSNFVLPSGQCISRSTYAVYFAMVSTLYGACDGVTTFGVPDVRGRVIAGKDDMNGVSANRLTGITGSIDGDVLGAAGGLETNTLTVAQMPAHSHTGSTIAQTNIGTTGSPTLNASGIISGSGSTTSASGGGFSAYALASYAGLVLPPTSLSIASQGSTAAHPIVQPTIVFNYLLRIQ